MKFYLFNVAVWTVITADWIYRGDPDFWAPGAAAAGWAAAAWGRRAGDDVDHS